MKQAFDSTIFAPATPPGKSGIAVVRISGKDAKSALESVFKPYGRNELESHVMYYGRLERGKDSFDDCMAVFMKAPKSYTGEDSAELHLHGGRIPVKHACELLQEVGLVPASNGEFTKRAFLNGKLDLSQAEAVMDFISAETDMSAKASLGQLRGSLSAGLEPLKDKLLNILAQIDVTVDYPEDDLESDILDTAYAELSKTRDTINTLIGSFSYGRVLKEGVRVAITGRPNVGKSSLLNAILGQERVIVTDIPGTTRDTLEECYEYKGLLIRFVDTAGIRHTADAIERFGVERAKRELEDADAVLLVFDGAEGIRNEDIELLESLLHKQLIVLVNKSDISDMDEREVKNRFKDSRCLFVSAKEGHGMDALLEEIYGLFVSETPQGDADKESVVITSSRHKDCLKRATKSLKDALTAIGEGTPVDCVAIDVREAWRALCEITGEAVDEDIIDRIFESFCVGK